MAMEVLEVTIGYLKSEVSARLEVAAGNDTTTNERFLRGNGIERGVGLLLSPRCRSSERALGRLPRIGDTQNNRRGHRPLHGRCSTEQSVTRPGCDLE